ncbi:GNAT family N-acetyltransferase [Streptomyces sp. NPDC089424]|uniref:GNAT family N-acetyltransferase n=1 Tax=Streptomyces sp. NPDC089424 TaxID=3365917 RepID=UPI00382E4A25
MELRPAAPADAAPVAAWPTSSAEAVMWCGRSEFPVAEQTISGWWQDDDVQAHVLVDGEKLLAYGELWFDAEENEVELARLVVDPDIRGQGLGRELVRRLLARAVEAGFDDVFMRVHPGNDRALRCYLGAGFEPVDPGLADDWNAAQPVNYTWLRGVSAAADDHAGQSVTRPSAR